jgi:anti-sigma-K factor RskA
MLMHGVGRCAQSLNIWRAPVRTAAAAAAAAMTAAAHECRRLSKPNKSMVSLPFERNNRNVVATTETTPPQ